MDAQPTQETQQSPDDPHGLTALIHRLRTADTQDAQRSPDDPRWFAIAIALMSVHQVQSVIVEPNELAFRTTTLTIAALSPLTFRLPRRIRGMIWILIGIPPFFGAWVGHLIPIMRDRRVPPASETAPFNLAGAAFLIALGIALLRSPAETPQGETTVA